MALFLDIIRGPSASEAGKRISNHGLASTPEAPTAVQFKEAAQFTTSGTFRQYQSELFNILKDTGLTADQSTQLIEIGRLPFDQLVRVILIAQTLKQNKELFQRFAGTVRNIISLGKNVQEGLKNYLDGLEGLMKLETEKFMKQIQGKNTQPSAAQRPAASSQENQKPLNEFEASLYRDIGEQIDKTSLGRNNPQLVRQLEATIKSMANLPDIKNMQLTPDKLANLRAFQDLTDSSVEEFPQRYPIDLYSFSQLNQKGMPLETYIKLASEVSPLRIINLLSLAEKMGQSPSALFASLISTQENGGSVTDALKNLEHQFNSKQFPTAAERAAAAPATHEQVASIHDKKVTISQGDKVFLDVMAMTAKQGTLSSEKTGFVLFPNKLEYAGRSFDLSFLPVGVYMVMVKGLSEDNEMMNMWIRVIVEERKRKKEEEELENFKRQMQQQKKDDQKDKQQQQQENEPEDETSYRPPPVDPVTTTFDQQPANYVGPFLGEIVLPLDYLNREAGDLMILSSANGIIVDKKEYDEGNFSNNAIAFRFLTNHMESTDIKKRHELLNLKHSRHFEHFDEGLKKFMHNPKVELDNWKKALHEFFDGLKTNFPSGQKTFEVAEKFFIEESTNHAEGKESGMIFENHSIEKNDDKFMAALYARGSYALARAGDVGGALHGMSFATLTDIGNINYKAVLGEYLEEIRHNYYRRESGENSKNRFDVHINHNIKDQIIANPFYKKEGEAFIKATKLIPPNTHNEGPTPPTNVPYGYAMYRKY